MMNIYDIIPHDLDGEVALDIADFLYRIADQILRLNDGAIRMHYDEIDDMSRARASPQLSFPWDDPFQDLPF